MTAPILPTGGTGMVGHNIRDLAAERGLEIVSPSRRELDLSDGKAVHAYVARLKPAFVVHAAGRVGGIEANMRDPVAFITENWDMGRYIVMAAREAGVPARQLVHVSKGPEEAAEGKRLLSGPLEPTNEA